MKRWAHNFILKSASGASFSFNCPQAQCREILSQWHDGGPAAGGAYLQKLQGYDVYTTRIEGTDLYLSLIHI